MKILVTGAKGFIGKNLIAELKNIKYTQIFEYDIDTEKGLLDKYCKEADFVFNFAGINRTQNTEKFMEGNFGFTSVLVEKLKKYNNTCPILISSSIQAKLDNYYGKSKKAAEDLLFSYGKETGANIFVYRLSNVFGKWCRPNYNSVVATFCNNIACDLPITVNDPNIVMELVYIDDVVNELISVLFKNNTSNGHFFKIPIAYKVKLGKIVDLIYSFKLSRENNIIPDMSDAFTKKLYATYFSYIPKDRLKYPLKMNIDDRGSFTEIIRTDKRGQFSVNISKNGIVKGNHWHQTKNEKFVVVSGKGVIRLRMIDSNEILEYHVSGDKIEVVDIPPGYTHNIENLGNIDLVTFMWCSECFDLKYPDTNFLEV